MDHTDEVWHLAFSHDGTLLATGGADGTAIIWHVAPRSAGGPASGGARVTKAATLRGHTGPVAVLAWAPRDDRLATAGPDATVRLWAAPEGTPLRTLAHHGALVTAVAWLPDGARLATAGHDRSVHVVRASDGASLASWRTQRVNDMAVTPDGALLLTCSSERRVRVWDLDAGGAELPDAGVAEGESIISLSLSRDGRSLLLNLANQTLHAWDASPERPPPRAPAAPTRTYTGPPPRQGRFVVRSCYGGRDDAFVLSGSEDCRVYVWHRGSGALLAALEGHSGTVNAVAWNPADPGMFASASDDKSVHVWGLAGDAGGGGGSGRPAGNGTANGAAAANGAAH